MAENLPPQTTDFDLTRESNLARVREVLAEVSAAVQMDEMRAWLSIVAKGEFDAFYCEYVDY